MEERDHQSKFRFGDSEPVRSDTVKLIPTTLCGKSVVIKANVGKCKSFTLSMSTGVQCLSENGYLFAVLLL